MSDVDEKPRIRVTYCTQCGWMLRAGWMAQELLSTFGAELGEVALVPGTGGVFAVHVGEELIWERKRDGGFPDAPTLKQKVRDAAFPGRELGHMDRKKAPSDTSTEEVIGQVSLPPALSADP